MWLLTHVQKFYISSHKAKGAFSKISCTFAINLLRHENNMFTND